MSYTDTFESALMSIWEGLLNFLPSFVVAAFVFVLGLFIGAALQRIVERLVRFLWVDRLLKKLKITDVFQKAEIKLDVAKAIGVIANWFVVFAFLVAATDIVGLSQVSSFLRSIVNYLPNLFVAAIILAIGFLIASWVHRLVYRGVEASRFGSAGFVAGLTKWSIVVFSVLAALVQLRIAAGLLQTLFTGVVFMLALAGGLAFGLGGKDTARQWLERMQRDMSGKR